MATSVRLGDPVAGGVVGRGDLALLRQVLEHQAIQGAVAVDRQVAVGAGLLLAIATGVVDERRQRAERVAGALESVQAVVDVGHDVIIGLGLADPITGQVPSDRP